MKIHHSRSLARLWCAFALCALTIVGASGCGSASDDGGHAASAQSLREFFGRSGIDCAYNSRFASVEDGQAHVDGETVAVGAGITFIYSCQSDAVDGINLATYGAIEEGGDYVPVVSFELYGFVDRAAAESTSNVCRGNLTGRVVSGELFGSYVWMRQVAFGAYSKSENNLHIAYDGLDAVNPKGEANLDKVTAGFAKSGLTVGSSCA